MKIECAVMLLLTALIAGCSNDPGPMEGTWKADGPLPFTITFRSGETEAMGVIEHVDYTVKGNVVSVTYKDGLMQGSAIKFVIADHNTAVNSMYTLRRVQ